MRRLLIDPRSDWQEKVESLGLIWHTAQEDETAPAVPYWNESAVYTLSKWEASDIANAARNMYQLFLEAGDYLMADPSRLVPFDIPAEFFDVIQQAWNDEPPCLNYGRFDFAFDGMGPPKLLEFNCDTPTSLLEAAVIQSDWLEEVMPEKDQFNIIHDALLAKWADIKGFLPSAPVYFAAMGDGGEDTVTIAYLRDTAESSGIDTRALVMEQIGYDPDMAKFVDPEGTPIEALYKLYPWEMLVRDQFGKMIADAPTVWMEPIWKMIWSNKAILPVLWQISPFHQNLLEASLQPLSIGDHVKKPILGREGGSVSIVKDGNVVAENPTNYGSEGFVYQRLFPLPELAPGTYPVVGSWIVDGEPCGIGIREGGLITGNKSQFVPHIIE